MVTESHRQVSSFSKLALELAWGADQTTSRIVAELGKNLGAPLEKRFCYRDDVKKE